MRKAFGFYVANFPTYETIYGALSVIPIFLIWMYLSWLVVLFGAEIVAGSGEWRVAGGKPLDQDLHSGRRLAVALMILARLSEAGQSGAGISRKQLLAATGVAERTLEEQMKWFKRGGYAETTADGRWMLARDLDEVTLFSLLQSLDLELRFPEEWALEDGAVEPWERRMMGIARANSDAQRALMATSVKALLAAGGTE